ncbi:MAG: hypothetical protein JST38_19435 [Bacteroidetes bacterium]|nr:hypothetical protein [Bacteroidota bacterium]
MADGMIKGTDGSIDLVLFLWRKRRPIIGITLLGFLTGVVAAIAIPAQFKSEVILFPAITNSVSKSLLSENSTGRDDILALGDEEDAEQLLQILNSDMVGDRTARRFELLKVYKIDPEDKHKNSKLREAYEDHVKFEYTKFGSVRVSVLDHDPQRAADMANFITQQVDSVWKHMSRERALKGYNIVKQGVDQLAAEIAQMEDSMTVLRSLGVQDYHSQAERYNEYLGAAIVKGDQRAIGEFERRFAILAKYGGAYVTLQDRQFNEVKRLSVLRMKLEQAQADLDNDLPHKFVVNQAFPADRKSWPISWLVIAVCTISAGLLALFLIVAQETLRKIKEANG